MTGPGAEYESESARRLGARHAIAFAFARHALASVLAGAGVRPGDEVLLSPLTCKVVPLALLWAGLTPVYADISPQTLNIDPLQVEARVGSKTAAILFQHTYGNDTGLQDVAVVAARHGRLLVEDCAQCLPLSHRGAGPGAVGRAAVFSNNLLKPLPAGSGGLVTTNDDDLAARIRESRDRLPERQWTSALRVRAEDWLFRRLVRPSSYGTILAAYQRLSASYRDRPVETEIKDQIATTAYRPSRFQMEAGARWLQELEAVADHRRTCCADYRQSLVRARPSIDLPPISMSRPLLYFPVLFREKPALLAAARARRLPIVAWPGSTPIYPVERIEALRAYGYAPGTCPNAEAVATRLVGLPTDLDITAQIRRRLINLVLETSAA